VLSVVALGQQAPDSMTKMVVTYESPAMPAGSFPTLARTLYRSGLKYCRSEDPLNPAEHMQLLTIVNEPDVWTVNLVKKKAEHIVDTGTPECRMPIFRDRQVKGRDDTNPFLELEYAMELAYFKGKSAAGEPGPEMRSKATTAYSLPIENWQVTLYTTGTPERPLALIRERGNTKQTYWYEVYEQVPFDGSLFAKPSAVKIQDVR
jgi:hypothetical protein